VTTVLVDSCVIIDLLAAESDWYEWAMATISALSESRALAINQIIYAEIAAVYDTPADLELALAPFEFIRLSLPWEAAFLSGTAYRIYRQRGWSSPLSFAGLLHRGSRHDRRHGTADARRDAVSRLLPTPAADHSDDRMSADLVPD
jgi:hypothetical protein